MSTTDNIDPGSYSEWECSIALNFVLLEAPSMTQINTIIHNSLSPILGNKVWEATISIDNENNWYNRFRTHCIFGTIL